MKQTQNNLITTNLISFNFFMRSASVVFKLSKVLVVIFQCHPLGLLSVFGIPESPYFFDRVSCYSKISETCYGPAVRSSASSNAFF